VPEPPMSHAVWSKYAGVDWNDMLSDDEELP
jgi:hypothetical protein